MSTQDKHRNLVEKMQQEALDLLDHANEWRVPSDHELRSTAQKLQARAKELSDALDGFIADPQTCSPQKLLGCWARARRLWCDCSGEELI